MIGRALRDGFRCATRRPGLVAFVWSWNLALALLATLPFWRWTAGRSSLSPETDVLLHEIDLGILSQLIMSDRVIVPTLLVGVGGLGVLALVSGALMAGGILEVVTNDCDDRPLLHRFFRGAGHFFGRFLRLLAIGGAALAVAAGACAVGLSALTRALVDRGNEAQVFWTSVAVPLAVGLVIAFFLVVLDYARVLAVLSSERRMLRVWWRAVKFVFRRTAGTAVIAAVAAAGVLAALAACAAYDFIVVARSWPVIAGAIVLQQGMAWARTAVRVGQWGAEASYARRLLPGPAAPGPVPDLVEAGVPAGKDEGAVLEATALETAGTAREQE